MAGLVLDHFRAVKALGLPERIEDDLHEALIEIRRVGYMIEGQYDMSDVAKAVSDALLIVLADKLGKNIWEGQG